MVFTSRFYLILALSILLALASLWEPESLQWSLGLMACLLAGALLDGMLIPRTSLELERMCPPTITQGASEKIAIRVKNHSSKPFHCEIKDSPPPLFEFPLESFSLALRPQSETTLYYTVRSFHRGKFTFGKFFYRIKGFLQLVEVQVEIEQKTSVLVFPDVSASGTRDLLLSLGSPFRMGHRPITSCGEGTEFESLREHHHDDDFRSIDWKASAKRGKLISRQYQAERDQRLLILMDLGRLMGVKIGPYQKIDYAIHAAVRLAQLALHQGDRVGLVLFSHQVISYLPPRKGSRQFSSIVHSLVFAQPHRLEPNYPLVFNYAARQSSRRTLMVCFTDLLDLSASESLVEGLMPLIKRHLPLTVTMSDSDLLHLLQKPPQTSMDVYQHAAAQEVWDDYQHTLKTLQSRGVLTVNVPAADLTLATLNRYLQVKKTARL